LQEVDRLVNLVQSWLELTQMEANPTMQLQMETVELRSLITSVWETLEPLAQRQNLSLSYSGPEQLLIKADSARIYQVFLNLLDNSIKYSSPNTSIQIQAEILSFKKNHEANSAPPILEINLIDAGKGFADEDLPHVFERFYRGDKARTHSALQDTNIVGNGLGLAIVRQIILAHGGSIKAMNHSEIGGAWIQLHIPEVVAN